eukprot:CAMPEP_0114533982 /NCGR_PEP_ID=MMETSP0109-20121206/27567_1 /TAXON_ID=29199 /ORGANISM="Chlorarachnion reptans, Strain CCCM449" /LENGTH=55 /DNA_ID=CAMNT_0001717305 /DNA_START=1482 /DNA_END=1649 /DNA_ORIENTATION=+
MADLRERAVADLAPERLLAAVDAQVLGEVVVLVERSIAHGALVWPPASVRPDMPG